MKRISVRLARTVSVAMAILAASVTLAEAQSRNDLLDQARAEVVGSPAAFDLLLQLTNPEAGPIDSLWAVGAFDLADNLINVGESELAAVWLRWVARHGGQWPIDRSWYSTVVTDAYDAAVAAIEAGSDVASEAGETSWVWPETFNTTAVGRLEVEATDPGVTLTVEGRGAVTPGQVIDLVPGSYRVFANAPGFDPVEITREVLPGATTVVDIALPPALADDVRASVLSSLARISFTRAGQLVCSNGVVVDSRGLVLTTLSSVLDATSIEVVTQGGTYTNVEITPDAGRDLAVLRLQGANVGPVLPRASAATAQQYAWALHQPGCADPTQARTRLPSWPAQPQGVVGLSVALPDAAAGSPLVDRSGSLFGLVMGPTSVMPAAAADELIARARGQIQAVVEAGGGGGGIPSIVWIAAGVGVAGGAAALLLGGGGDGGNGGNGGNGSITLTFPGGP